MKKLILALLMPLATFAQTEVVHEWVNLPQTIAVGDIITYQQSILDLDGVGRDFRLVQTDIAYNNKLLTKVGEPVWNTAWDGQSKSVNHWIGYEPFNSDLKGTDPNDLDTQYSEGLSGKYVGGGDWNIQRHTIQATTDIEGVLFTQQFRVEDISATNYTDYTNVITVNWAYVRDIDYISITDVYANPQKLDISGKVGVTPAGTITFQLDIPNMENIADYSIMIESLALNQAYQTNGTENIDFSQYPPSVNGNFDTGGKFITSELLQNEEYIFHVFVDSEWDQSTQTPTYPQWLDDVVTVSDVIQTFKQVIGTNPNGTGNVFEYSLQEQLANVKRNQPNDPLDFQDSYALLAHIAGILENSAQAGSEATEFYPITSFNNGSFNWSGFASNFGTPINSQEEWYASKKILLADDQPVTFNIAHGLMGDADLSHSTTPELNETTQMTARFNPNVNVLGIAAQETIDLDVVSKLENGKVVVEIDLTKEDLVGMQFNIAYDKSLLQFDDLTFDTGNQMTNFAKHFEDGRINFGTINTDNVTVKTGKPFKMVFTPKVALQNTVGLVTFKVTDAVNQNGSKVNLNIK